MRSNSGSEPALNAGAVSHATHASNPGQPASGMATVKKAAKNSVPKSSIKRILIGHGVLDAPLLLQRNVQLLRLF
jgi:hypothetical protein